jgi:pimeloyl-ACP methyl ester carboxylesterase
VQRPQAVADAVEIPGPWEHRYVAANGARFHVARSVPSGPSRGPLVLLLHGFPEFWWAWRAQLPALAEAGYRATAMDLRGYGGSDKTPRGYDPVTLAQDVSGVVKALGERRAVLVGHGWGGYVGWATAVLHPREVSALCAVAAPHPSTLLRGLWPAPHCALEYDRWLFRSRVRADGRHFDRAMRTPVAQPVLLVTGAADQAMSGPDVGRRTRRHVTGPFRAEEVPGAAHFPHEERPEQFTALLLDWLGTLP